MEENTSRQGVVVELIRLMEKRAFIGINKSFGGFLVSPSQNSHTHTHTHTHTQQTPRLCLNCTPPSSNRFSDLPLFSFYFLLLVFASLSQNQVNHYQVFYILFFFFFFKNKGVKKEEANLTFYFTCENEKESVVMSSKLYDNYILEKYIYIYIYIHKLEDQKTSNKIFSNLHLFIFKINIGSSSFIINFIFTFQNINKNTLFFLINIYIIII